MSTILSEPQCVITLCNGHKLWSFLNYLEETNGAANAVNWHVISRISFLKDNLFIIPLMTR